MRFRVFFLSKPVGLVFSSVLDVPSPSSISSLWNVGFVLGVFLVVQIFSGVFVSMFYVSDSFCSFDSVIHLMRDVYGGWLMRFVHINGASFMFFFLYFHIARGLFFFSSFFFKKETWLSGVFIFVLCMATAFLGYVLPWGQMSLWGATVITNLFSAIPFFGDSVVKWLWGNFSVSQPTLNRFFSLHFLLPFLVVFVVFVHLILLHDHGSSNPLGLCGGVDKLEFYPVFALKDLLAIFLVFFFMFFVVFNFPLFFGDPENFNVANSMMAPVHIQPEWYFLFAYAILRSVPSKVGGVVLMFMSIFVLVFLVFLSGGGRKFSLLGKFKFWFVVFVFFVLTWVGGNQVEDPFVFVGRVFSFMYFFFMIFL